jgi:hypothetical protein
MAPSLGLKTHEVTKHADDDDEWQDVISFFLFPFFFFCFPLSFCSFYFPFLPAESISYFVHTTNDTSETDC